ncbi:hypothetical protein DXA63_04050 [Segatella copri]|jgi:hypothetical protein|uniref:Uncharacterized protein n=1 Tax=Segatella copri TaxID=165179 RepID=A0AA93BJ61_9BACT|nr:hypothetical protein DXA63_04050 [Segatella copri]
MILPTKGMIFRKKYGGDKEPIDTRTYKSFFSKKVSKSHFLAENEAYIFNIQNFTMNETSLKMEGEVSSKYHKMGRSIMISCLHRKKMLYEVIIIAFARQ